MKSTLLALSLSLFASIASADTLILKDITTPGEEVAKVVLYCTGGTGEAAGSLLLTDTTHGYVAQASVSWLAGTHMSGKVPVQMTQAPDGGPTILTNTELGFSVRIQNQAVGLDGKILSQISGSFVDSETKMAGNFVAQNYSCR